MWTDLLMDRDLIRTRFDKYRSIAIGISDHQVSIESQLGDLPDSLHHRRAEGEIWHEVAVHYIDVQHSYPCALDFADLIRQPGKVRRQYRWKYLNHLAGSYNSSTCA